MLSLRQVILNIGQLVGALLFVAALAAMLPGLGRTLARRAFRFLGEAAARPRLVILFPILASIGVSIIVFSIAGPPLPHIHDEFAHLLAADTFAHGRLTNSTPLDWPSFETMHVLMHPTYMSKFGPAQGFTLAIGQVIFNQPWMGLILTTAAACAAMAWCLRAFMPPRWALTGGLLAAVHPEIVIWSHEYWGGNVGLIGGALVLGALTRLDTSLRAAVSLAPSRVQRAEPLNAALLALGLGILANSRPYEAAIWGIISLCSILSRIRLTSSIRSPRVIRIVLAGALVLAPIGAFMGYYNFQITGHATQLPYTEHVKQYMAVPLFFWQAPQPSKAYNNPQFVNQYDGYERAYFNDQRSMSGWFRWAGYKIYKYAEFHLLRNLVLSLGLIAMIASRFRRDRHPFDPRMRLAVFAAGTFIAAYAIIPWFEDHYTGASLAVLFAVALYGIRLLRVGIRRVDATAKRRIVQGRAMVRFAVVFCLIAMAFVVYRERRNQTYGMQLSRATIEARFKREGGKHLVIVHYEPNHFTGSEWVYNRADLNTADVIWVRDLSPEADNDVIRDHGSGRQIWILYPDGPTPILHGYGERQ